jgi:limonene 1,2-monooxygenase
MIGLDIGKLRTYLEEDVPVLLHLLRSDDPITVDTGRYRLDEAKCQLDRFSDFDVAVASMFTASGPLLAGRYGLGLLQLSGLSPAGMEILPKHWGVMEAQAKKHPE